MDLARFSQLALCCALLGLLEVLFTFFCFVGYYPMDTIRLIALLLLGLQIESFNL